MVKAELGTKRTCPSCGSKFYDLLKSPIICPKCGVSFIAAALLPSKGDGPQSVAKPVREAPQPKPEPEEVSDVELVSLEEVEEGGDQEDETAAIADVDLGEEEETAETEEDFDLPGRGRGREFRRLGLSRPGARRRQGRRRRGVSIPRSGQGSPSSTTCGSRLIGKNGRRMRCSLETAKVRQVSLAKCRGRH